MNTFTTVLVYANAAATCVLGVSIFLLARAFRNLNAIIDALIHLQSQMAQGLLDVIPTGADEAPEPQSAA